MTDTRFVIKDTLASLTGSLFITDDHGQRAYEVAGSLVALGRKVTLRDLAGTDLFTIHHKVGHLHETVVVTTGDGSAAAEVVKTIGGIRHTLQLEGAIRVALPATAAFLGADLAGDPSADLDRAER